MTCSACRTLLNACGECECPIVEVSPWEAVAYELRAAILEAAEVTT